MGCVHFNGQMLQKTKVQAPEKCGNPVFQKQCQPVDHPRCTYKMLSLYNVFKNMDWLVGTVGGEHVSM